MLSKLQKIGAVRTASPGGYLLGAQCVNNYPDVSLGIVVTHFDNGNNKKIALGLHQFFCRRTINRTKDGFVQRAELNLKLHGPLGLVSTSLSSTCSLLEPWLCSSQTYCSFPGSLRVCFAASHLIRCWRGQIGCTQKLRPEIVISVLAS